MDNNSNIKKKKTKTKRKLIIESSSKSSSSTFKRPNNKRVETTTSSIVIKKKTIKKREKREKKSKAVSLKKKLIIVDSSSPSSNETKQKLVDNHLKTLEESIHMTTSNKRLNETFIDLMEQLSSIMLKQGEPFRARAYQKAQETIMSFPKDITSPNDLKGLPGIGPTIMDKLNEYVTTGTLKILEREKNNPVNILADIYGVGPKKATDLVEKGITNIEQLRAKQELLNDVQKVGLKYYEDILKRIPRSEIENYKQLFETTFLSTIKSSSSPLDSDSRFEIVGSYRRGAETSGDIDVIITSNDPTIFKKFLDALIFEGIIVEVLSRGPSKCLVIAKIPNSETFRRVDFLYASSEEFPFSILYFTGSKAFNTLMRHQALTMGLSMNEHGLYKMEGKKKGDKIANKFSSEKDIFDFLNMVYKAPTERIDGRAVVLKSATDNTSTNTDKNTDKDTDKTISQQLQLSTTISAPISISAVPVKKTKTAKTAKISTKKKERKTKKVLIMEDADAVAVADLSVLGKKDIIDPLAVTMIQDFKKNGISVLEALNEAELAHILREANKAYYNEETLMTDNEYDIVKEFIEQKYPSNAAILEIGAPIERNKATLPYKMASMDKIKPDTGVLEEWTKKYTGPYVLSCKLDGVSGLYTTEHSIPKLYTRGNGTIGQDVSHLIPYLRLPKTKGIVIRGEFIIPKSVFIAKYKTTFANPRNMVAGIINHKTIDEKIKDIHFVAYEVIKPVLKPSEQMNKLMSLDVECVLNQVVPTISNEFLSSVLVDWRTNYLYEIDGVIVVNDKIYERQTGNPEHAFAFKMVLSDQIAEAKVVDVIWTPSKDGYLKPRVQIEPIHLGGVKIEYATGFNGSFINDNKVGIGSIIELIRSGDVIPHIKKVVVPAENAKMPSVPYKWNDTHVDVMLEDIGSDEIVKEKNITGFFRGIGVEGLSGGNVARIIKAGFDSVEKIIKMSVQDFLSVEGFKGKLATKIHDGIQEKISTASLVTLMSGSNLFGRGFSEKKIELIMESYPDVLVSSESLEDKVKKVAAIKGMALKTAEAFVEKIPGFIAFMKTAGLESKLAFVKTAAVSIDPNHPLFSKSIVMTGFRDATLIDDLKLVGAKLGSSVSKNTFVVLVKDLDASNENNVKVVEAKKLGIPIMTPSEFRDKYLL